MRVNLVRLVPENDIIRGRVFDDAVLPFYYALRRLGHQVEMVNNRLDPAALSLVFGANVDPAQSWLRRGPRCVIVNLEQFRLDSAGWGRDEVYLDLLAKNEVWDYSAGNIEFLKNKGIEAGFFKFGYVPEMSRLAGGSPNRIDALFYGALNERRLLVMEELGRAGIRVKWLNDVYGLERERAIYDSRVVLNIHSGRQANLEIIRLSYLLANRKAVVSELNEDTERYPELEGACAFFPYDRLAAGAAELFGREDRLREQAEAGFRAFSSISLVDELRPLAGPRRFFTGAESAGAGGGPETARGPLAGEKDRGRLDAPAEPGAAEDESRSFFSGPWADWITPDDGLKVSAPDYSSRPLWLLRQALFRKMFRAWRYRRRVRRCAGRKKCWYMRKLDRLEREIGEMAKAMAARR